MPTGPGRAIPRRRRPRVRRGRAGSPGRSDIHSAWCTVWYWRDLRDPVRERFSMASVVLEGPEDRTVVGALRLHPDRPGRVQPVRQGERESSRPARGRSPSPGPRPDDGEPSSLTTTVPGGNDGGPCLQVRGERYWGVPPKASGFGTIGPCIRGPVRHAPWTTTKSFEERGRERGAIDLTWAECEHLLRTGIGGRIAWSAPDGPHIVPVNYPSSTTRSSCARRRTASWHLRPRQRPGLRGRPVRPRAAARLERRRARGRGGRHPRSSSHPGHWEPQPWAAGARTPTSGLRWSGDHRPSHREPGTSTTPRRSGRTL